MVLLAALLKLRHFCSLKERLRSAETEGGRKIIILLIDMNYSDLCP